jgi:Mg-chelatase subunit ChlD
MRLLIFLCLLSQAVYAGEVADLRLIQARADLPAIDLWLDLSVGNTLLKADQFNISIGSHPVSISAIDSFNQTGEGMGYIFLVDVSKSLNAHQFTQIKQALQRWLDGMNPNDKAALITFGSEVRQQLAFTSDQNKLNNAVALLAATDMETNLFRGLLEAIALGRQQSPELPERRAIVVLSDGIDDSVNGVSAEEVLNQSSEYRVPIHSIGFVTPPLNDSKRKGLKVLGMLARQSGGYFVQAEVGHLDAAYESQRLKIAEAYRLRLECADCVADGQSYRLNLTWNDGQHSLNDGLDLRLLPKAEMPKSEGKTVLDSSWLQIYIISLASLVVGILLLWLYRRSKIGDYSDDAIFQSMEAVVNSSDAANAIDSAAQSGRGSISLTVVSGTQKGHCHRLQIVSSAIIGRLPSCELCLGDDAEISAQHAVLRVVDNRLMVRDLRSTNGTLVNGVPIHNEYPLRNGDLLLLGRTELRVNLS